MPASASPNTSSAFRHPTPFAHPFQSRQNDCSGAACGRFATTLRSVVNSQARKDRPQPPHSTVLQTCGATGDVPDRVYGWQAVPGTESRTPASMSSWLFKMTCCRFTFAGEAESKTYSLAPVAGRRYLVAMRKVMVTAAGYPQQCGQWPRGRKAAPRPYLAGRRSVPTDGLINGYGHRTDESRVPDTSIIYLLCRAG
jgi:hypothetical protein